MRRTYTRRRPLRATAGWEAFSPEMETILGGPPETLTIHSRTGVPRTAENTISRPSGIHAMPDICQLSLDKGIGSPPRVGTRYRSLVLSLLPREKAICCPSGENFG